MKPNFRTAVLLGVTLCGFAAQLTSQAQSQSSTEDKSAGSKASSGTGSVQAAFVEFPAVEGPDSAATKPGNDSTSAAAASSNTPAKPDAGTPGSSTTSSAPGANTATLKNEAVIKELAD